MSKRQQDGPIQGKDKKPSPRKNDPALYFQTLQIKASVTICFAYKMNLKFSPKKVGANVRLLSPKVLMRALQNLKIS